MCFGSTKNTAADEARRAREETAAREAERQANIKAGQASIDSAFSGFNDNYFNDYASAYTGHYNPELDTQYADARDKLMAAFAGRGMLNSAVAAKQTGDLQRVYGNERAAIASRSLDAANDLRSKVEQQRTDLYNLNASAADPEQIAAQSTAASTAIKAPQAYNPLGEVFASVLQPLQAYISASNNSVNTPRRPVYTSPTSSGRVVN